MQRKQAISKVPAKKESYHNKRCFAADFIEADKKGEVIVPKKGENTLQAVKRYVAEKKKKTYSIRLPIYVANAAKAQAKEAGIPYTSYLATMIERAIVA